MIRPGPIGTGMWERCAIEMPKIQPRSTMEQRACVYKDLTELGANKKRRVPHENRLPS